MTIHSINSAAQHDAIQLLLPWLVSGQLDDAERASVEEHLAHCPQCRADIAIEQQLRGAAPSTPVGLDQERALDRMMARIDAAPRATLPARARRSMPWMPWMLALQSVAIGALAAVVLAPAPAPVQYRALSSAGAPAQAGNLVVVFGHDVRQADMQRILQQAGARVVDGPTVTGAWVLEVPPAQANQAMLALRGQAGVELAEAMGSRAQP